MNVRRTTVIVAILAVLAAFIAPLSFSGESDAISDDEIRVSIPGYTISDSDPSGDMEIHISAEVNNGKTLTIPIIVMNLSSNYLTVILSGNDYGDIAVSGSSDKNILEPANGNTFAYAQIDMNILADNYADNHTSTVEMYIGLSDMIDENAVTIKLVCDVQVQSTFYSEDAYNKFFGMFPNTLPEPLNSVWITALVTIIGWMAIAFVFTHIVTPLIGRLVGYKKTDEEKKDLNKSLGKTIGLLIFIMAINQCLSILGTGPSLSHAIGSISNIVYIILLSSIAWQIYMFLVTAILSNVDDDINVGVDSSLIPLFKMLGKIAIGIVASASILACFGVDLAGILVSAGVVTLGITLGAQNTLNQFFSGIVLLATRPFKKGDFVKIGTETYMVHNVRLMFCEFENWDKDRIITMPNNMVASSTIVNLTRDSPNTKIFIYMSVAYDADLTLAKELMIRAAEMHPHTVTDGTVPGPSTRLTNFLDSGIEYRLACFVDDFDSSANVAGQIREIIFKLFGDNGIEIPYNRLEVTMLEPCDGKKKESDTTED